jgi:hypothetical protein
VKCHKARAQLQDYLDNQLPVQQQAKLERHLAGCLDCRGELAFIKTYRLNLAEMKPQAAPPDLLAKVRLRLSLAEKLTPQKGLWKTHRTLPVLLPGLAGTALLAVLVVFLARPWEFNLNAPAVNRSVAQTTAPTPTADLSVELSPKQIPAGRADVSKSVAPKSISKFKSESTSSAESEPKLKSELESIFKSASESTSKATPAVAVDPAVDQSGKTLLKGIMPPRKGQTVAEAVVTVAIPAAKPSRTKSLGVEPGDEAGAADQIGPRLQNLLKSIDGVVIREEAADRRQLPLQISITISPANYSRLIAGLKELGEVSEPSLGENPANSDLWLKLEINYQADLR